MVGFFLGVGQLLRLCRHLPVGFLGLLLRFLQTLRLATEFHDFLPELFLTGLVVGIRAVHGVTGLAVGRPQGLGGLELLLFLLCLGDGAALHLQRGLLQCAAVFLLCGLDVLGGSLCGGGGVAGGECRRVQSLDVLLGLVDLLQQVAGLAGVAGLDSGTIVGLQILQFLLQRVNGLHGLVESRLLGAEQILRHHDIFGTLLFEHLHLFLYIGEHREPRLLLERLHTVVGAHSGLVRLPFLVVIKILLITAYLGIEVLKLPIVYALALPLTDLPECSNHTVHSLVTVLLLIL